MPSRRDFEFGIFGGAGDGLLDLGDDARIERPRDIEEDVVECAQADHGGDVIAFRDDGDFRLGRR